MWCAQVERKGVGRQSHRVIEAAASRVRTGGTHTILTNGLRIQIIWKIDTPDVGNHRNHVHVGIGRA